MNEVSTTTHPTDAAAEMASGCSLSPEALQGRLSWIRDEILPHAVTTERADDGITWELDDAPGLAARLDQLVALERQCCPGLQLAHATDPSTGRRRLQVAGIDPDAAIFTSLQVEAKRRSPLGGRVAKAAGFGAVASLLLCCVIPLSAAAILGTAAATDFKQLENPVVLAGFALVFGVAVFAWLGRRRATTRCSC